MKFTTNKREMQDICKNFLLMMGKNRGSTMLIDEISVQNKIAK